MLNKSAAADLVLALHVFFALFAVFGGFLALVDWRVTLAHIPVVAWTSIVNLAHWTCPLTPLEKKLRQRAGQQAYDGSWTENYLEPLARFLGTPRRLEVVIGVSILVWNALVYAVVFWTGHGA